MSKDHDKKNPYLRPRFIVEAALVYTLFGFLRLIGLHASSALGGWIARTVGPRIGRSKTARSNLTIAYPQMSEADKEALVIEMWDNLGRTVFEYPHFGAYRRDAETGTRKLLTVKDPDALAALMAENRPIIFISTHSSNWELLPIAVAPWRERVGEVVRPANNPYIDRLITKLRSTHIAPHQIPKGPAGMRGLLRLMKSNGLAALLVDQKDNNGIMASLFGQPAMSPTGAAGIALRYGCDIVPVTITRLPRSARFVVEMFAPLPRSDKTGEQAIAELVQDCNDEIERMIRANPGQWMWLHNRFRKAYVKDKWKDFVDDEGKPIR